MSRHRQRVGFLVTAGVAAALVTSAVGTVAQDQVEFDVYDLHTVNPGLSFMRMAADAFQGTHPNVKVNVTTLENEALKDKIAAEMSAGTPPDMFQSWGGGLLRQQVGAGLVQDITAQTADIADSLSGGAQSLFQIDGKQYGVPYNFGLVGLWYNKDLLAQAGITAPATTWEEFLTQVQTLKDAGITPISLGGGDQWPSMFWWAYLALRIAGGEALGQAVNTGEWNSEPFVKAGQELARLVALDPFQAGADAATHDEQQGTFGNGKAAYMLQGQWTVGSQRAQSESRAGIPNIGWSPFPAVEGGAGAPSDAFGGGDGFSIGRDAPAEAIEFAKYLVSPDVASVWQSFNDGTLLPTKGAEQFITDPALRDVVTQRNAATFAQLYLDQATPTNYGTAINEAVAGLIAGALSPEEVVQSMTDAAAAAAG
jgi:raffinose/stachyose/melibiose transport system substrate-binding protein